MVVRIRLGDRMKAYELEHRTALPPRAWTVPRLDGRAFGTWTSGLQWPYSTRFIGAMGRGMVELCEALAVASQQPAEARGAGFLEDVLPAP